MSSSAAAASGTTTVVKNENPIKRQGDLGFPFETPDPFLFCVYHVDHYPAGDDKMQVPAKYLGDGNDFTLTKNKPFRMYHSHDLIPGFPQHPHRGFETITTTIHGHCDHSDSLSNSGRFGNGDTMFLTAGSGIAHAEVFPLIYPDRPNTLKLFQIWLNLPRKSKMQPPHFDMHWAENVKTVTTDATGGAYCRLYVGGLGNETNNCPIPPASWAKDPKNEVGVFVIVLPPGGSKFILPPCQYGNEINRYAYLTEGKGVKVSGTKIGPQKFIDVYGNMSVEFVNLHPEEQAEILILQGRPINEPIAQRGPFVMNTHEELAESFSDYRRGKFGQWPWSKDAMSFPRDKGRFASYALGNGKFREDRPPTAETNTVTTSATHEL